MNKTFLIGRTTKDIECRYTPQTQKAVARFTLAVNRMRKEDGADFISCVAWGKTAEIMEKYVKKGHMVGISGRIQTGSYEKDGRKVYTTDVVVEDMEFLEKREKNTPHDEPDEYIPEGYSALDEDLPF
jgi:single-strand DNA-binding protein